jgi:hypothetical protein
VAIREDRDVRAVGIDEIHVVAAAIIVQRMMSVASFVLLMAGWCCWFRLRG